MRPLHFNAPFFKRGERPRPFSFLCGLLLGLILALPVDTSARPGGGDAAHDFHVSVMRVDYNTAERSLEVSLKIFTDDIERSLEVMGGPKLRLGSEREYVGADSLLDVYLHNRVELAVNGQARELGFLGKEVEMDVMWCYIEFKNIEPIQSIALRNEILFELFDDQSNLIHLYIGGEEGSMLLHKGFRSDELEF